jgi:hypothetical protein
MHGMDHDEKKWQRERDLRTLREAEELKADKGRLDGAKAEAKAQMDALAKVYNNPTSAEAREKHNTMYGGTKYGGK